MATKSTKKSRVDKYITLALEIAGNGGVGEIDGVKFALHHGTLDQDEFLTHSMVANFAYLPSEIDGDEVFNAHQLWFPWFGTFDDKDLLRRVSGLSDTQLRQTMKLICPQPTLKYDRIKIIDQLLQLSTQKYFVESGDRLIVARTEQVFTGQKYLHQHDAEVKHVYLSILKPDESHFDLVEPYVLIGKFRVLPLGEGIPDSFVSILYRLLDELKLDDPDQLKRAKSKHPNLSRMASIAYALFKDTELAWNVDVDESKDAKDELEEAEALLQVINDAACVGFMWAKFEADQTMRPLAEKEEWRRGRTLDGAIESVKRRKEKARIKWRDAAEAMAKKERKSSPSISQDDLAEYISDHWSLNDDLPGHARLKQFISELENSGRLSKRIPGERRKRKGGLAIKRQVAA
jgi:hypothetical protein